MKSAGGTCVERPVSHHLSPVSRPMFQEERYA